MARAYGSSAHLLMKRETVYGQAATGNYIRMPFNRCNLGSEQGLIDDPVLGQGRDPLAPLQDVINDEGDIVVPVDPRYLGLWLTGLFGDPDTTDNLDGSWDHEFASGGDDLPSYTIEVGMPKVPAFFLHAGVKLNSIALEFTRSGPAAATISAIAQGETRFGTTQGGTPTSLTFSRISQFQGSIKRAGIPVGNLTGGSVTYSNNLEKIETIRDDGLIEGADPTIAALTGRIDVRFADTTLIDLAAGGTPVDLEFAYTLSAQAKLVLTAHEVYLPKPKLAVEGPGGVQASFDFRGAKNTAAGRMLTVTLTNDLDGHGLRVTLPGSGVGHTRLIHRSLLRLIPESVDECDGRMTFSLSLGVPGEDRDSVGAERERRIPQSARPERSSGSAGWPPSPIAARSGPAIARRKRAGAARRRTPADPARCRAPRTAR